MVWYVPTLGPQGATIPSDVGHRYPQEIRVFGLVRLANRDI